MQIIKEIITYVNGKKHIDKTILLYSASRNSFDLLREKAKTKHIADVQHYIEYSKYSIALDKKQNCLLKFSLIK